MTKRVVEVTLRDRDRDLAFKIEEMSATRLESWLMCALLLLGPVLGKAAGEDVSLGEAGRLLGSQEGWNALSTVDYPKAKALLDEMLECCTRIDAGVPQRCTTSSVDSYVSDVSTLIKLRMEALKLNLDFLGPGRESLFSFLKSGNTTTPAAVEVSRT